MAPIARSPSSSGHIAALVVASFFGSTVVSASIFWVYKIVDHRRRAANKARLVSSIPPSSNATSEYNLVEGTGMPAINNNTASTTIWTADEQVIDNFDGTSVVLTRPAAPNDRAAVSAARCADNTTDERGRVRSGLTVPLGKYVAKNDLVAIRAGCPQAPSIYAMEAGSSISTLDLGESRDITEADVADRGANAQAAASAILAPVSARE